MHENGFYNMDCIEGMKDTPDKYYDLAIVDPVYGDVTTGSYMTGKYAGKMMSVNSKAPQRDYHVSIWSQEKTGAEYFEELFRVSKNQIIWGGNYFVSAIKRDSQCWIVWDKQHTENIKFADAELAWTSFPSATRVFRYLWNGFIQADMANKEERIHPTQKPVALYKWLLHNYAKPGDIILDTHAGSASSLVACRETGHPYTGYEIDEVYYRQAKARLDRAEAQMNIFDLGVTT